MTIKALRSRCAYWAARLNLKEWHISLVWGTPEEMKDLCGCVTWHTEELKATVKLSKKVADKEGTLVHELLHIVLQGHADYDEKYDAHLERAINRIAAGLVAAQ